eukprot:scaffold4944_cov104-Skeletonema_dohrnii-CCMP3373.AAC.7
MVKKSKRLLSAAAVCCCCYTTCTILATTAAVKIPFDDSNLANNSNELHQEISIAADRKKKRRLRGPPLPPNHQRNQRSLQEASSYLSSHPYYPTHTTKSCSNDGNPPSWMTWSGGYAEAHLFGTAKECCDKWFPDNRGCYVDGGYSGHGSEEELLVEDEGESEQQQLEEEIVVENYHQRPIVVEDETSTSTTAIRPTRPTTITAQQQEEASTSIITPPPPTQPEATFPTSSCGTNLFTARDCTRLCLPGGTNNNNGNSCLPEEACFPNILCPASQVAAAMGDAGSAILQHISIPDHIAESTNTINVCGVDYNDAESKCKNVVTGEVYMDNESLMYIECPDGTGMECPGEMQCFGGILCARPPTVSPTVGPTTGKPTDDGSVAVEGGAIVAVAVDATTTVEKKDKTEVVGMPPAPTPITTTNNHITPPAGTSSTSNTHQNESPYSIDKSTLGTISVASESCNDGCPASSKCVGNQAAGQLIEDSDCHPCSASGQTWWPCDVP